MISTMRWMLAASTCFAAALASDIGNAAFPDRPVHMLIGQKPGGSTDAIARIVANALSQKWGQTVIVENKPGANGALAADTVAHATPDGYTILLVPADHTITPNMQKLNFDPIKSFTPVTKIMVQPNVLVVNPKVLPVNNLKELIAYAKERPGKLSHGSGGTGTPSAMEMVLLSKMTGIKVLDVPFQSGGPSLVALLAGEVQMSFASIVGSLPQMKAGEFRAMAVSSDRRVPMIPDVPTVEEAAGLKGYNLATWDGILAPPKTPPEIVSKVRADIVELVNTPDIKEKFYNLGFIADTSTSTEDFTAFLVKDIATWGSILKSE